MHAEQRGGEPRAGDRQTPEDLQTRSALPAWSRTLTAW
jgi:hypothetical protein